MEAEEIELIVAKLFDVMVLIPTNKINIFITIVVVFVFCRIIKSIHHHRQFPIFTAKCNGTVATGLVYCAVCLHDVDGGQRYRRLPQCRHCFHVHCIDTWLQSRSTCPLCRNQVPIHLLPRKQKEHGFLYLFIYFSIKAIRRRIESNFNKILLFEDYINGHKIPVSHWGSPFPVGDGDGDTIKFPGGDGERDGDDDKGSGTGMEIGVPAPFPCLEGLTTGLVGRIGMESVKGIGMLVVVVGGESGRRWWSWWQEVVVIGGGQWGPKVAMAGGGGS
ncbi:hypothetical protein OSB04_008534 [Centaurea solstitialis]|uniref:RING-type domain-containing protein n=1 Tax=Centaurea solstitialis TaxID=347529 RepID=A0AA38WT77_9ASTR|nr:hypothetical protein OSB04_008534 [Centaurea solstitialis]